MKTTPVSCVPAVEMDKANYQRLYQLATLRHHDISQTAEFEFLSILHNLQLCIQNASRMKNWAELQPQKLAHERIQFAIIAIPRIRDGVHDFGFPKVSKDTAANGQESRC